MKKRFLKIFVIALALLLSAGIIAGAVLGFFARREIIAETFTVSAPELPEAATDSARGVPVGSPFEVRISTETALSFQTPFRLELSLPEGLEARENAAQHFTFDWTHRRGDIRLSLLAFNAGEFNGGKIELISSINGNPRTQTLELPTIFAALPETEPDEQLRLAGSLSPSADRESHSLIWLAAVILPLIALAVLIFLRRRKKVPAPEIPVWVLAQSELDALRDEISSGRLGAIAVVTRLSDIVRRYLSRRFTLSADAMTSQEFFASMERGNSPLASKHRQFLREFLSAADLIKFAGVSASAEQAHSALERASALVRETVPAPEPPTEKA